MPGAVLAAARHRVLVLVLLSLFVAPAGAAARGLRLGDRPLAHGSKGPDVGELQRTLTRLAIPAPRSGRFDRSTLRAVLRYERRVRMPVDGRVSRSQATGMRRRAGTLPLGSRTLRRGSRGRDVRRLQTALDRLGVRTGVDGVFGDATQRAVRRYERRARVRVDGVVSRPQGRAMARATKSAAARPAPVSLGGPGARRFPIAGAYRFARAGGHFGDRGGAHRGEDVFAACGTPLVAVEAGIVAFVGHEARAGHYVVLRGAETGMDHVYMHLPARTPLAKGEPVLPGLPVGAVGRSGNATACHLHFELWTAPGWFRGGGAIDPLAHLHAWRAAG